MSLILISVLAALAAMNVVLEIGLRLCTRLPASLDGAGRTEFWRGVRNARMALWRCIGAGLVLWLFIVAVEHLLY
jgi:hypothetical protein